VCVDAKPRQYEMFTWHAYTRHRLDVVMFAVHKRVTEGVASKKGDLIPQRDGGYPHAMAAYASLIGHRMLAMLFT
jgi:hypothetical protein